MVVQDVLRLRWLFDWYLVPEKTLERVHHCLCLKNSEVVMKRRNIALTLMASFCLSGAVGLSETRADNPFEKLIPRGKLLKKLKGDFTGEDTKVKLPVQRHGIQPRSHAAPTPASQAGYAPRTTQPREPNLVPSQAHSATRTRPLPPISAGSREGSANVVNANANRKPGFGMMVQKSKNDKLVVSGVQRGGNASRAGLRPGDQLLSFGGGKLTGMEELTQIAKTLGQGDQVEVEFNRQGKKQKSLLQFGLAPQEGQIVTSSRSSKGTIESVDMEMDSDMLSVLDSPVEHISRRGPIAASPAIAAKKPSNGKITSLNETIEQQQSKMEAMAEELKLLRKAHQPAVEPTENNWTFPDLAGPEAK